MKSFLKRSIAKFQYAFQGLRHGLGKDRSIQTQAMIGAVVIIGCIPFSLYIYEWILILSMILLVLAAEFLNSAIETLCDKLYPEYHPEAKKTKDYAAAAVLLISMIAAVIGIYVIGGKLF